MKTITILLTKYSDFVSSFIYHVSGRGYTHASLAIGEDENRFYSFNYRGFCIETIECHRRRGVTNSLCYQIQVHDAVYADIKSRIHRFEADRDQYQYTRIGVVFAVLQIPFRWKNRYTCSRFVGELLSYSGAMRLQKDPSVYLPNQLGRELEQFIGLKAGTCNLV